MSRPLLSGEARALSLLLQLLYLPGRLPAAHWTQLELELSEVAQDLTRPGETIWGVSALVAHGLVVRAVTCQGSDIAPGLLTLWRAAKRSFYAEDAILPRKIY